MPANEDKRKAKSTDHSVSKVSCKTWASLGMELFATYQFYYPCLFKIVFFQNRKLLKQIYFILIWDFLLTDYDNHEKSSAS